MFQLNQSEWRKNDIVGVYKTQLCGLLLVESGFKIPIIVMLVIHRNEHTKIMIRNKHNNIIM